MKKIIILSATMFVMAVSAFGQGEGPVTRIVSNLSVQTTSEDLWALFSSAGEVVSAVVQVDPDTGRSKGFGYVVMANSGRGQGRNCQI